MAECLDVAAKTWCVNTRTAQQQMHEATDKMLEAFMQILRQLDATVEPASKASKMRERVPGIDRRIDLLGQCETELRGLLVRS